MSARFPLEQHRPRLLGLAYRMLGLRAEAEDVVQDVLAEWCAQARHDVKAPLGWLVTTTTRRCIDRLRSLALERSRYPGPWLPEPLDEAASAAEGLDEIFSVAFLVLLERLAPEERAAFLLATAFELSHLEIGEVLGKSQVATRQLLHRARERVRAECPSRRVDPTRAQQVLTRFLSAWEARDQSALLAVLSADVTYTSDGGGRVSAARRVVAGADRVARFLLGVRRKFYTTDKILTATVGGSPGWIRCRDGKILGVSAVTTDGLQIQAFHALMNPEKLQAWRDRDHGTPPPTPGLGHSLVPPPMNGDIVGSTNGSA